MNMPTYQRRFFLGLLTRDVQQREEKMEAQKEQATSQGGKGNRNTRVSGDALKTKLRSGQV